MNAKRQYGQGLPSFMLGLVLATIIIAAVVYWLNRSSSSDFKEPTVQKELPVPEILTPKQDPASATQPPETTASSTLPADDEIPDSIDDTASATEPSTVRPVQPEPTIVPPPVTPPKAQLSEPKPSVQKPPVQQAPVVKAQPKAETPPKSTTPPKTARPKEETPSPEQILESGNVEKAREHARRQAAERERERKKAEAALSGKADKSSSSKGDGKTVVQAGAYGDRDAAESQRAKLAMMGVNANIVAAEVKGQTMYRVQTAPSNKEAATETRKTLQQNGVESFVRSE